GVAEINSMGGFAKQYHVKVNPERLRHYQLTLAEVYAALAKNNANSSGGQIPVFAERYLIRGLGLIGKIEDIGNIVLREYSGTPIYVRDVAEVKIGTWVRQGAIVKDGVSEQVAGIVQMVRGGNAREVVNRIKTRVAEINEQRLLPGGLQITAFYDRTDLVDAALLNVAKVLVEGIILVIVVLFVFLAWQVVCTIPYVSRYQFDTLRDAMLYGYALFALIIMLMTPKRDVQRLFDLFGKLIPFILPWYPILFVLARTGAVPIQFPGAPNGIFYTKGSDIGVHLAGVGAYMLLQLDRRKNLPPWLSWFNWLMWSADVVLLGAMGRGIMVAVGACMGIVVLFRPFRSRWDRPLILGLLVISLLLVTGLYSTLKVDLGLAREVSVEQLVENVTSIFGEGNNSAGGLEGTKQWRLRWWTEIINYTFNGQYFWRGKGYGINLADSDGFQVQEDNSLRSPHNGHLTFLARSGVPGFVLWVIFQALIVLRLLRYALQGGVNSERSRYALWILAYLVAFGIEAAVDVFLEGPMGGIWFWAIIGFVLVYFAPDDQPPSVPHSAKPELTDAYRPV
ncbi:MAG: efflux RND transporter permease subunit, partial [Anaerolineae bacterium]|nr:efflux RND transporter permease subunit [Anaerolineae bacterium]